MLGQVTQQLARVDRLGEDLGGPTALCGMGVVEHGDDEHRDGAEPGVASHPVEHVPTR